MTRYEVRDWTAGSSLKKYHVWDSATKRDVFHTDKYERADQVVRQAATGEITQHLKDYGHAFVVGDRRGVCAQCKKLGVPA